MKNRFFKTNGYVGSSVLFWAMDGHGYTTNIDLAHVYTREETQRDVDNGWLRDKDEFPLCADDVEALAQWRVDCQYVKKTFPDFTDPNDEYVLVKKGRWDGNDLAFANGMDFDFDYSKAKSFRAFDVEAYIEQDQPSFVIVPRYHTDEIARRTFQKQNINRRKMITAAGITGLRQKRTRKASGKNRFNCIYCGRIIWDFAHPDDGLHCGSDSCTHLHEVKNDARREAWRKIHDQN
ncbi:hypothetical protein CGT81_16435 [Vibrio cholerae]|uniref:hypothetical protein n=1 Tax=Vibrio cholerae TaxID=666 RepID=UPI000BA98739|nr:hypothetical protein [Vibrio cholerae]PAR95635.1 hypothetical protein CGT81_16435 [Vibrio cholerae]